MWIRNQPGWLYEALPYLYLASGIATIVVLRSSMAVFSGLMLISAGTIVWWMRTASRRRARDVPRFPPGVRRFPKDESQARELRRVPKDESTSIAPPGFLEVVWRSEYEVGQPEIDEQHRNLFAGANALLDGISTNQSRQEVRLLLDRLAHDLEEHFRYEEGFLEARDRAVAEAHRRGHDEVRIKVTKVRADYVDGRLRAGELISLFIFDLIGHHVTSEDRDWAVRISGSALPR